MAISDTIKYKINTFVKNASGYIHMYLSSNDVLMDDDKTTLQTKMTAVEKQLLNCVRVDSMSVSLGTIAKSGTSKPTVDIPSINGYIPILATVKGSGSNNVYNYYLRIDSKIGGGDNGETLYSLYSEWKNTNASASVTCTANVNILYIADTTFK